MTRRLFLTLFFLLSVASARAAEQTTALAAESWRPKNLGEALGHSAAFAIFGVAMAIAGYKLFDLCTPGRLHHEIVENRNVAAAIVGGAVIIGVSVIVAASMIG